jgi:hypothetical protein
MAWYRGDMDHAAPSSMTPSTVALAASGALLRAERDDVRLPTYVVAALYAASELGAEGRRAVCTVCLETVECQCSDAPLVWPS